MGSFDYTCAVSGLPIGAGDDVRLMLLTQNPYHRGKKAGAMTCSMNDVWFPRTFPLRGKYNDYGGVDRIQGPAQQAAWLAGFKVDLVQKGVGDNSCHDVAAKKSMPLGKLLDAVREGRIHVRQDVGDRDTEEERKLFRAMRQKEGKPLIPIGIPTRLRVERALVKAGIKLGEGYRDGVVVNRVDANTVRVRAGSFDGQAAELTTIRDLLADRWAGMVRCGSGNYADSAELILCPHPNVRRRNHRRRKRSIAVASAVIREDVWQAICAMPAQKGYGAPPSLEPLVESVRQTWTASIEETAIHRRFLYGRDMMVASDLIPFTVGLGTHWWAMVDLWKARSVSAEERDEFLRTAAELMCVTHWLGMTRYQWHPSSASGPQCGFYGLHAALLSAFASIAAAIHKDHADEIGDTDDP